MSAAAILAVDLSLTATGWAALWPTGTISLSTIRTKRVEHDHNGWTAPIRHHTIVGPLSEMIGPSTLICKEDLIWSKDVAGSSILNLAQLHAVFDYVCASRRAPIAKVNLQWLKQFATGKGGASKADMMTTADQMLAGKPYRCTAATLEDGGQLAQIPQPFNDNEADALWLLAMAAHQHGRPLYPRMPVVRAARLDRVAWPQWRWPE